MPEFLANGLEMNITPLVNCVADYEMHYKPFDEMPIICLMRKSALKLVVWPLKFPLIFPIYGNGDDWAQSLSFNLDRISWIVISVVNEHEAP